MFFVFCCILGEPGEGKRQKKGGGIGAASDKQTKERGRPATEGQHDNTTALMQEYLVPQDWQYAEK